MSAECDYDTRAAAAAPERVSTRSGASCRAWLYRLQDAANKKAREAVAAASAAGVAGAASETIPGETPRAPRRACAGYLPAMHSSRNRTNHSYQDYVNNVEKRALEDRCLFLFAKEPAEPAVEPAVKPTAGVAGAASETIPGETTVEVTLYETCSGQRGWTEHESTKRTRGTEAGEKRALEVIAQHHKTFSPLLGHLGHCVLGDIPPPSMQRLPAFFAHSLAIAQFPGKTGGEWKQIRQTFGEHGRRGVVHTVTLTFWGE